MEERAFGERGVWGQTGAFLDSAGLVFGFAARIRVGVRVHVCGFARGLVGGLLDVVGLPCCVVFSFQVRWWYGAVLSREF